MYQGLRILGGLLVVLGLVFQVGFVVYLADSGILDSSAKKPFLTDGMVESFAVQGANVEPLREAIKADQDWQARSDQKLQQFRALSLVGLGMIDLAVIGLGLGLRAIADMAEKLARVSIKK
jgi:hypothetical protein